MERNFAIERVAHRCERNLRLHLKSRHISGSCRLHESGGEAESGVLTHNEIVLFRRSECGIALVRSDVGSHVPYHGYLVHRVSR